MVGSCPTLSCPTVLTNPGWMQAFELHPAGRCDPPPHNKRFNRVYRFLGPLSLRRVFRPTPPSAGMDIHHNRQTSRNLSPVEHPLTFWAQTLTFLYHATQNRAMIKRETTASLLVVSVASFLSMSSLLLQLHLTRENEPEVPVFVISRKLWDWAVAIFLRMRVADERAGPSEL